jgi:hypothetical protein
VLRPWRNVGGPTISWVSGIWIFRIPSRPSSAQINTLHVVINLTRSISPKSQLSAGLMAPRISTQCETLSLHTPTPNGPCDPLEPNSNYERFSGFSAQSVSIKGGSRLLPFKRVRHTDLGPLSRRLISSWYRFRTLGLKNFFRCRSWSPLVSLSQYVLVVSGSVLKDN